MAEILRGRPIADVLQRKVSQGAHILRARRGIVPRLTVVRVGDDSASRIYVRAKLKRAEEVGMRAQEIHLPRTSSQQEVLSEIAGCNANPDVHGILVQLPLPGHIHPETVLHSIDTRKDVDGLHPLHAGRLLQGRVGGRVLAPCDDVHAPFVPCTAQACMILLQRFLGDLSGRRALMIGRSNIVGKPMALLLLQAGCTVTVAHRSTRDLPRICRDCEIVVAAVGKPEMVRGDWLREGATVIDVGISRVLRGDKLSLVGDVAFSEAVEKVAAITPVPGGVGPMTIACLLCNLLRAACPDMYTSFSRGMQEAMETSVS